MAAPPASPFPERPAPPGQGAPVDPDGNRRVSPRVQPRGAASALGDIIDLSITGLRVRCLREESILASVPINSTFNLEIRHNDDAGLFPVRLIQVQACRNAAAPGGLELGLAFEPLDDGLAQMLKATLDDAADATLGHAFDGPTFTFPGPTPDRTPPAGAVQQQAPAGPAAPPFAPEASATPPRSLLQSVQRDPRADAADTSMTSDALHTLPGPDVDRDAVANDRPEPGTTRNAAVWAKAFSDEKGAPEQRRHGRLRAADTTTSLGDVMDISASGMRIRRKGNATLRVGHEFVIQIHVADRICSVPVQVVRIQKVGWRTTDFGLRFMLNPEQQRDFGQIARLAGKTVDI